MASPDVCTVTADFLLPDANPIYRMEVRIEPAVENAAFIVSSNWIGSSCTYYTDADGNLSVDLVRGVTYKVSFGSRHDQSYEFECPDVASASLFDYLFPYVSVVDMSESSYSVSVGDTVSLSASATLSDGSTEDVTSAVTFSSADPAVASVDGNTLTGVAAGSTTVVVDTVEDDELPVGEDIWEDPIVVLPTPTYSIGGAKPVTVS